MRFQNIADTEIDAATAANFINSQLKAFGNTSSLQKFTGDFEKAQHVIDATNEVANNFAVGTNDLQNALTKAGSALSVAGNTFEQTIGMVTAGTEIMVGQPAKVGRGLRTIAINISKLAQGQSELSVANGKYTVSLQDQEGQMRSTYDIMNDLGKIWGNLNETEQTALATQLAGKTQFEVFSNVMKNWESAVRATTTAQDAQGSSLRENERYLDSIEGKLQNFQSAWEQLSYHVVNSDMIKGFIDFGTAAITTIDSIVQALDQLPGKYSGTIGLLATALGSILGSIYGGKKLTGIVKGLLGIGSAAGGIGKAASATAEVADAVGDMADATATATGGAVGFIGKLGALSTIAAPLAGIFVALAGAIGMAYLEYKNSFNGKLDEYHKLQDEVAQLEAAIDSLKNKEGELTSEEETRLSVMEMQLGVLKRQEELKHKELTHAFDKDAKEAMRGKTHMEQGQAVTTREDTVGDKYLKSLKERLDLENKIKRLEEESRKHPLTEEQTKDLEKYNKQLDRVYGNEADSLERLIEEHEKLAEVDYASLKSGEGKGWYDNIHSAYLQASTDIQEVRDGIANTISAFGSAQFDSWNIDVSSLKSAEELTEQVNEKIKSLDGEEEITLYARDETGSVIDEFTHKKSELTDKEWELVVDATTTGNYDELKQYLLEGKSEHNEVLIDFVPQGLDTIESEKLAVSQDGYTTLFYNDGGTIGQIQTSKIIATNPEKGTITFSDNGTTKTIKTDKIAAAKDVKGSITFTSNIGTILSNIKTAIAEKAKLGEHATGKRKGEKGGLSWLGDEGTAQNPKPELVVGEDGAYLAGTTGWEMRSLKSTDTVYTHAQTKKLLGGKQSFAGTVTPLPMYKKGKKKKASGTAKDKYDAALKAYNKAKKGKNKKKKKSTKKALDKAKKALDKKRSAFDSDLDTLEYRREVEDWTEARFQEEYANLVNRYGNNLSTEQRRAFNEEKDKYQDKLAQAEADRLVGLIGVGATTAASAVQSIDSQKHLSADEKKDYKAQAYKASVEYNLKEYQNGKKTRDQILADIKNYYNTRGTYDDEYYKMVDDLREADKKKELERLDELKDKEENKLSYLKKYAQRQRDYYNEQIDKEKEEADELEKLVDLQEKLNNAKKTMVKVYREGVGFVYEQDTKAIREAQKALDDYNKEHAKSDIEQKADEWQKIIDLIDDLEDLSDMKELELKLGIGDITDLTGGDIGTDITKWTEIIKKILSTMQGYEEISKILDKATGADIENLIGSTLSGGDKQIADAILSQYFERHSFASGSLSTPSGFSLLGESGPEIGWLNKGSSVFSNAVSKNLMEWGQYSPAQILEGALGSMQNQVFNFDKIVLPNVRNAEDFYKELQLLPNKAIQQSASRI